MPVAYRTQAAENDLRDIAFQIGIESGRPLAADQIIDELFDCCDQIAQVSPQSSLGTLAEELGNGVRLFSYRRWVILFRYIDNGLLVLRIADGAQDYLSWSLA
jgi:plasmid stabilization system protein ParE